MGVLPTFIEFLLTETELLTEETPFLNAEMILTGSRRGTYQQPPP